MPGKEFVTRPEAGLERYEGEQRHEMDTLHSAVPGLAAGRIGLTPFAQVRKK